MCWGDVQLYQTTNGEEFLEYIERQTKTRTGENLRDVRQIKPKNNVLGSEGSERDPVVVYKFYAEKRPLGMNDNNAPFYLAVNNCKKTTTTTTRFFETMVQKVSRWCEQAEFINEENDRKSRAGRQIVKNHRGRKTMIQT